MKFLLFNFFVNLINVILDVLFFLENIFFLKKYFFILILYNFLISFLFK